MKKIVLTSILLLISLVLFSQKKYLNDVAETQELSKKVGSLILDKKVSKSFDQLIPYWPLPQDEFEYLKKESIKQMNLIEPRFGKAIELVKVKNETISDLALRETYLVRYNKSAVRLIFTYYKSENGWIVNAFKWDDSFAEEFK